MKIRRSMNVTCQVNGCDISVPSGMNYLTIGFFGAVEAWHNKPYIEDGLWRSDEETPVFLCSVELEDDDEWTQVFLVQQNRFKTYNDCDA